MKAEDRSSRAGPVIWGVVFTLLAVVLGAYARRERAQGAEFSRQEAELRRETDRARRENGALKGELKALESDPVYLESLLRQAKKVGPGERLVE